ncbi:hypothetical protein B7463_g7953, partial [Scytalidium lignicola]
MGTAAPSQRSLDPPATEATGGALDATPKEIIKARIALSAPVLQRINCTVLCPARLQQQHRPLPGTETSLSMQQELQKGNNWDEEGEETGREESLSVRTGLLGLCLGAGPWSPRGDPASWGLVQARLRHKEEEEKNQKKKEAGLEAAGTSAAAPASSQVPVP